jgi:hypothetical protein
MYNYFVPTAHRFQHKVLANKVNMEIVHSIYKVTKHIITNSLIFIIIHIKNI